MFSLAGKVALITGSASGIGAAMARCFGQAGATVYVADRDQTNGPKIVEEIRAAGGHAHFVDLDVTSDAACQCTIDTVLSAEGGRFDILINNAGIGKVGTILDTTSEDLDRLWAVNLKGMFFLCKSVLPVMIERKWGSIINMASIGGIMGMNERFAYCITKHAVVGLTKCMAMDHGGTKVRINCICPGRVDTPFVQARLKEYPDPQKFLEQMAAPHALKRMAKPEEIAAAALYLAADESAFVTGSCFMIDGGYAAGK